MIKVATKVTASSLLIFSLLFIVIIVVNIFTIFSCNFQILQFFDTVFARVDSLHNLLIVILLQTVMMSTWDGHVRSLLWRHFVVSTWVSTAFDSCRHTYSNSPHLKSWSFPTIRYSSHFPVNLPCCHISKVCPSNIVYCLGLSISRERWRWQYGYKNHSCISGDIQYAVYNYSQLHRQLWDTGACAPPSIFKKFFQFTLELHKVSHLHSRLHGLCGVMVENSLAIPKVAGLNLGWSAFW